MRTDKRIKYYATPLVRASVFKKLSSLLSTDEDVIPSYFDVVDLKAGKWNDIEGLEIRPIMSLHPVENLRLCLPEFLGGQISKLRTFGRYSIGRRTSRHDNQRRHRPRHFSENV